jgi:hypothetical protein
VIKEQRIKENDRPMYSCTHTHKNGARSPQLVDRAGGGFVQPPAGQPSKLDERLHLPLRYSSNDTALPTDEASSSSTMSRRARLM